jgi:hypothetical protein
MPFGKDLKDEPPMPWKLEAQQRQAAVAGQYSVEFVERDHWSLDSWKWKMDDYLMQQGPKA